ncbi:unnamed protein product [Dracunculus medinensis]|uniref:Uncharacterized protein n=1 Tax=Dracunculus medinensis TaxID=318479 RepID=A0A3P7Q197_DRAME|nr:unnamed protein product [Dracunculus medinensis]
MIKKSLDDLDYDPSSGVKLMRRLEWSCLRTQISYIHIVISSMSIALKQSTPVVFLSSSVAIWKRLECIDPKTLFEGTVSVWMNENLSHESLIERPALLFRCDDRIYEIPQLFSCFLRILSFYLTASRCYITQKVSTTPTFSSVKDERAERDELARSLLGTQDSMVVQILLEICDRSKHSAIHHLCCGFIHQMFIADPILSKLVHFQTYPIRLIPMAVRGIPSMHICLEFIHELLTLSNLSQRVFAIVLVTELASQYKIESSYLRVGLILDVLFTLLRSLPCDESLELFENVVPSLGRIMCLFPQLSADITDILTRVSSIAKSRMAVSATIIKRRCCLERKLIDLINKTLADAKVKINISN